MPQRNEYRHLQTITTRWHDNDVYGHVNNVTYYSFFDSAVNTYLIEVGGLDIHDGEVVGFVVSSACDYFASIAFPDRIEIGLRVGKLGSSSVQYELAVFKVGEEEACAAGRLFTYSWTGHRIGRWRFRTGYVGLWNCWWSETKNRSLLSALGAAGGCDLQRRLSVSR